MPAVSAADTTISSTYGSMLYVDSSSSSPTLMGSYIGYTITNTNATADSDVWVTIGNFAGGAVSLAPNAASTVHVGALAAGASKTAFFYVQASTAGNNPSSAQSHTITVYDGEPNAGGQVLKQQAEQLTVAPSTIAANANKVNSVSTSTTHPALGGSFTVTVNGCTGQTQLPPVEYFTPAADVSWPANVFELTATQVKFIPNPSDGNCSTTTNSGTFTNELVVPPSQVSDPGNTEYIATYTFEAIRTISTSTSVSPVGYITSGTQVKHTSTGNFASLPPISPVSNTLTVGLSPSSSLVGASSRTVTFTATATNGGSAATSLDDFVATLPSGATYVPGSATYDGTPISDPSMGGQTATWAGVFGVPADGSSALTFQATMPGTSGAYTTSVIGHVASAQIDSTLDTSNSSPANTTVAVDAVAPTVALTSTPPVDTPSTSATFVFSSDEPSSYLCQVDSGNWWPCGSSGSYTGSDTIAGLTNGQHKFSVEAEDAAGNVSAPATYDWTIDTSIAPDAPTVTAPADGSLTSDNEPTITLTADPRTQDTVYIDGQAVGMVTADGNGNARLALSSPLADGPHSVYATASNGGAPSSPSNINSFTVDTTPPPAPVITAPADDSTSASTRPTVTLTAEPGSTDTIYIDGTSVGTVTADGSGNARLTLSSPLADGHHTVSATATDAAGTSPQSSTDTFTVDTTAPDATINSEPDSSTTDTSASFAFSSTDRTATFQCQLDGGPWTACTRPVVFSGLSVGSHTFRVRASDAAGNVSDPASYSWTIAALTPPPPPPAPPGLSSTGIGAAVQSVQLSIPAGGSVILLNANGNPASSVAVPGQGTYVLDTSTGVVSFVPALGFSGAATSVRYRVSDNLGQTGTATYTPSVTPPSGPAPTNATSTGAPGAVQSETIPVPEGGSITLLDGGTATTQIVISAEGSYTLDPATGTITFTPLARFAGIAKPITYRVTDAYGQSTDATYAATVSGSAARVGKPHVRIKPLVVVSTADEGTVPVRCRLSLGAIDRCDVSLVAVLGGRPVIIGHGVSSTHGRGQVIVRVTLTQLGRTLARTIGGKPVRALARVLTSGQVLAARAHSRVVAKSVALTRRPLLFHTDEATLLPSVAAYMASLKTQLAGARSVTCIGYPDSANGDGDEINLASRRANAICSYLARGLHLATIRRAGSSSIPGDLDRPQPVVGATILVGY